MLDEAARALVASGVKALPVIDAEGRVLGMLTETDFLRRLQADTFLELLLQMIEDSCEVSHRCHETPVREAMTAPAVTLRPQADFRADDLGLRPPRGPQHAGRRRRRPPARAAAAARTSSPPSTGRRTREPARYLRKMRGATRGSPPRVSGAEIAWSWLGAFLGIAAAALARPVVPRRADLTLMLGSLGASAVLLYGAPRSPLAQPRNLVGGHLLQRSSAWRCWQLLHPCPGSPRRWRWRRRSP